jgi:nucleoside-diphosphate-sugar epimerase
MGEEYCRLFNRVYGLEYNIVRPFNVYGSRMALTGIYTSAVATFINVLKNDLPLETFGTGEQRRDFIYIDDLVEMLVVAGKSGTKNEAFNCGFGKNYSINELYNLICKIMNKRIEPKRLPGQFEKKETLADIAKAHELLNWEPKIDLEEGLRRTINAN